jgi:hypothetical protein
LTTVITITGLPEEPEATPTPVEPTSAPAEPFPTSLNLIEPQSDSSQPPVVTQSILQPGAPESSAQVPPPVQPTSIAVIDVGDETTTPVVAPVATPSAEVDDEAASTIIRNVDGTKTVSLFFTATVTETGPTVTVTVAAWSTSFFFLAIVASQAIVSFMLCFLAFATKKKLPFTYCCYHCLLHPKVNIANLVPIAGNLKT